MVANTRDRNIDSSRREDSRVGTVDRCEVIRVHPHVAPLASGDKNFNTVDLQLIDRPYEDDGSLPIIERAEVNTIQHDHGRFQGRPFNYRVGDLVLVYWLSERRGIILGALPTDEQEPVCRSQADSDHQEFVFKLCPWEAPYQDPITKSFTEFPDPKHPECYKWWPKTRDSLWIFDCLEGHNTPSCCGQACNSLDDHQSSTCFKNFSDISPTAIDLPRRFKFLHHCGSFWYYDDDGKIHIASKISGSLKSQEIFYPSGKILLENVAGGCYAALEDDGDIILDPAAKVVIDGNLEITGSCTHNACSCDEKGSSQLFVDGFEVVVKNTDGNEVYRGTLGLDDTSALNAACAATPDNGTVCIGCCTLNLEALTEFELDPVHTFNTCLLVEGRNLHIQGCGKEATVLKLADNQHVTNGNPVAMILYRKPGQMDPSGTAFSVSNMTIDCNAQNNTGPYVDGCGAILSGSTREGERYENLVLKNSFGHGLYVGNNGSGSAKKISVRNVVSENCAYSGVMLDTVQQSDVSHITAINCGTSNLSGCGVEILGNSADYLTRKDDLRVSDITCIGCGLTIFYMNWLHVSNVLVDTRTSTVSRGLSIRDSKNVFIFNGVFVANPAIASSFGGASYISATQAGATEVNLYQCNFNGYYGLHLVGAAVVNAYLCACIGAYACIYEADIDPVTCTLNGYFTAIHPPQGAYGLYLASGSTFNASHCDCTPPTTNNVIAGTLNDWNTFRIY